MRDVRGVFAGFGLPRSWLASVWSPLVAGARRLGHPERAWRRSARDARAGRGDRRRRRSSRASRSTPRSRSSIGCSSPGARTPSTPATDRLVQLFPYAFWSETTMAVGVVIVVLATRPSWSPRAAGPGRSPRCAGSRAIRAAPDPRRRDDRRPRRAALRHRDSPAARLDVHRRDRDGHRRRPARRRSSRADPTAPLAHRRGSRRSASSSPSWSTSWPMPSSRGGRGCRVDGDRRPLHRRRRPPSTRPRRRGPRPPSPLAGPLVSLASAGLVLGSRMFGAGVAVRSSTLVADVLVVIGALDLILAGVSLVPGVPARRRPASCGRSPGRGPATRDGCAGGGHGRPLDRLAR